ncbi:TLC domain-containing protein At5g14285-like [Salvia hispanica]|uniref:TLC domain-containing protein At5g14285-like n=1 Tax=Salvia hispanica TaxID=49212 RepID=UPI002008F869|nr:TLC domain-containing protein At5g14285-like [Salvia hispanica]
MEGVGAFTAWFITIYAIGYMFCFKKWAKKQRGEASSCLISLAHGTPALILSIPIPTRIPKHALPKPSPRLQHCLLDHRPHPHPLRRPLHPPPPRHPRDTRARRSDFVLSERVEPGEMPAGGIGFYSVVRGIVGPLYVYRIPRWGWVSWIVVMAVGIGLSVLWVLHLWLHLYSRSRRVKQEGLK